MFASPTPGTVIGTLIAEDADGDDVTIRFPDYETESRALLEIHQTQTGPTVAYAELILKTKLDRDYVRFCYCLTFNF